MKAQYQLKNECDLITFDPVEGTWIAATEATEDRDQYAIRESIAADLEARHGFKVNVTLFHEDGRAIQDECPYAGHILAARK